ncbi:MAG TPA: hypothetical protein PLY66_16000 [Acidobacteriota bacterium]|nr:hypothetical protein [Acidobacteriota bacterium]HQF86202.1 hypothetical protein [Acidobacteriota bacterium]HQG90554.1 hypothetical protein [Acidobacteriota bacterium]HQK89405.1 hypothetical protein [Acidobacteriota bacterium]
MKETNDTQQSGGPWSNIQTVVWLAGLAILAWHGWWWPGILVLVAVSMAAKGMAAALAPPLLGVEPVPAAPAPPTVATSPAPEYRPDLLPDTCDHCGGPVDGRQIRWTGTQSAACSYCGTRLLLRTR